jgi:hypothetical protein
VYLCSELHEFGLLQLDFTDWNGVSHLDQVVVPSAHEDGEVGPHGWRDGGSSHNVALVNCNFKVNDWNLNASSQLIVGLSDDSVDLGLNLGLKMSSIDTKSCHEG